MFYLYMSNFQIKNLIWKKFQRVADNIVQTAADCIGAFTLLHSKDTNIKHLCLIGDQHEGLNSLENLSTFSIIWKTREGCTCKIRFWRSLVRSWDTKMNYPNSVIHIFTSYKLLLILGLNPICNVNSGEWLSYHPWTSETDSD